MQKMAAEFVKRACTCEGMSEPLSLERFSTFLRRLGQLQNVIATTQRQLQGRGVLPELDALEKEVTEFVARWETQWNQFLSASRAPFQPILYFEEFPDWKSLQRDIERLVARCQELTGAIARRAGVPFDSSRFMDIRERYGTVPRAPPIEVPETVPDNEEEP
ncbi:MAG: hypothetical protein KatS3mg109_1932 [Pirellulaceae bacterium]|nr:MAG: hypothetical protein KatS3mg109_1932 [Pirellulaceae bacterium]